MFERRPIYFRPRALTERGVSLVLVLDVREERRQAESPKYLNSHRLSSAPVPGEMVQCCWCLELLWISIMHFYMSVKYGSCSTRRSAKSLSVFLKLIPTESLFIYFIHTSFNERDDY